mgnify:CR=1 FL=1
MKETVHFTKMHIAMQPAPLSIQMIEFNQPFR